MYILLHNIYLNVVRGLKHQSPQKAGQLERRGWELKHQVGENQDFFMS